MSVVTKFPDQNVFDTATLEAMGKAYELGCVAIEGRPEADKKKLALLIVELAKQGVHTPTDLCSKAVNRITSPN